MRAIKTLLLSLAAVLTLGLSAWSIAQDKGAPATLPAAPAPGKKDGPKVEKPDGKPDGKEIKQGKKNEKEDDDDKDDEHEGKDEHDDD